MRRNRQAYVLIFTLAALAFATVLTSQLMRMVSVGSTFDQAMIDRERAEMLALGGINLAITQLTIEQPREKDEKLSPKEKDQRGKKEFTGFLERVLPNINRWQIFELKEEIDGIDGEVKICISCEDGKIDINKAFDFKKGKFKPEYEPLIKTLKLTKAKKKEDFSTKLSTLKSCQDGNARGSKFSYNTHWKRVNLIWPRSTSSAWANPLPEMGFIGLYPDASASSRCVFDTQPGELRFYFLSLHNISS